MLSVGIALAVVTSQARVAIVGTVVSILAFMLLATSSRRVFRLAGGLVLGLTIAYVAISALTSSTNSHLFDRYSSISPDKVVSTSVDLPHGHASGNALPKYLVKYPLGAGIGKVGPGIELGRRYRRQGPQRRKRAELRRARAWDSRACSC